MVDADIDNDGIMQYNVITNGTAAIELPSNAFFVMRSFWTQVFEISLLRDRDTSIRRIEGWTVVVVTP